MPHITSTQFSLGTNPTLWQFPKSGCVSLSWASIMALVSLFLTPSVKTGRQTGSLTILLLLETHLPEITGLFLLTRGRQGQYLPVSKQDKVHLKWTCPSQHHRGALSQFAGLCHGFYPGLSGPLT